MGDLSALTPTEVKALPIRSPKLSNVKKALKSYHEQQVLTLDVCLAVSVIALKHRKILRLDNTNLNICLTLAKGSL